MSEALLIRPIAAPHREAKKSNKGKSRTAETHDEFITDNIDVEPGQSNVENGNSETASDTNHTSRKIRNSDSTDNPSHPSSRKSSSQHGGSADALNVLAEASLLVFEQPIVSFDSDNAESHVNHEQRHSDHDSPCEERNENLEDEESNGNEAGEYETTVEIHNHTTNENEGIVVNNDDNIGKCDKIDENGAENGGEDEDDDGQEEADEEEAVDNQEDASEQSDESETEDDLETDITRNISRDQGLPLASISLDEAGETVIWHGLATIDEAEQSDDTNDEDNQSQENSDNNQDDAQENNDEDADSDEEENDEQAEEKDESEDSESADEGREAKVKMNRKKKGVHFEDDTSEEESDEEEQQGFADDQPSDDGSGKSLQNYDGYYEQQPSEEYYENGPEEINGDAVSTEAEAENEDHYNNDDDGRDCLEMENSDEDNPDEIINTYENDDDEVNDTEGNHTDTTTIAQINNTEDQRESYEQEQYDTTTEDGRFHDDDAIDGSGTYYNDDEGDGEEEQFDEEDEDNDIETKALRRTDSTSTICSKLSTLSQRSQIFDEDATNENMEDGENQDQKQCCGPGESCEKCHSQTQQDDGNYSNHEDREEARESSEVPVETEESDELNDVDDTKEARPKPKLVRRRHQEEIDTDIIPEVEDRQTRARLASIPRISVKDEDGISVCLQEGINIEEENYDEDWDAENDLKDEQNDCKEEYVEETKIEHDDKDEEKEERAGVSLEITDHIPETETPPPPEVGPHEQKMIDRLRNIVNNLDEQRLLLDEVQCPHHQKLNGLRQAAVETHGVISMYTAYVRSLTKNVVKISSRLENIHQTLDEKLLENQQPRGDAEEYGEEHDEDLMLNYTASLVSLKSMVAETLLATERIEEEIREARKESERRERERQEAWMRVEKMNAEIQSRESPAPEDEEEAKQEEMKEETPELPQEQPEEDVEYSRLDETMKNYNRMEQVRDWSMITYRVEDSGYNQGIGCVIRSAPGTLEEEDLQVTRIGQAEVGQLLEPDEELISDVIVISPAEESTLAVSILYKMLCEPWALAIPHCAPKTIIAKEVVIKARTRQGWQRLKTQDVLIDTFKDMRFAQTDVDCGRLTLAVVWRPRTDLVAVGKKGAHITSSADQRISFSFRPGVLRLNTEFIIKVTAIDVATVLDVKQRYPEKCQALLTCSPLIDFVSTNQRRQFVRPITVSVPLPPNMLHRGNGRPGTAMDSRPKSSMFKRPNSAFVIGFPRRRDQGERTDQVHLVAKTDTNWTVLNDVTVTQDNKNKDVVHFDMPQPIDKFFLLRTTCFTATQSLQNIAASIEEYLQTKAVHLLIRQKSLQPNDLVLVCCPVNKIQKIAENLAEEGYTYGPNPSREILVKEGQKLWVYFRGNLRLEDDIKTEFIFNSQMCDIMHFHVKEIDEFAQRCINVYRGFVQFFTEGLVQKSVHVEDKRTGKEHEKMEWMTGEKLLAELVITVPKPAKGPPKIIGRAPIKLRPDGVIDEALLRTMASRLGQEWRQLASSLSIKRARIQAILREHVHKDSDEVKLEMLLTWAKRVPRSIDKVDILCTSLGNVGRLDLAMELRNMDEMWKRNRMEITDEIQMRKYFVRAAQNSHVMSRWQALAYTLGLKEKEIQEIEDCYPGTRERCLQALIEWKRREADSSVLSLIKYLKRCSFLDAASEIESMIEMK